MSAWDPPDTDDEPTCDVAGCLRAPWSNTPLCYEHQEDDPQPPDDDSDETPDPGGPLDDEPQAFRIDSEERAAWLVGKLLACEEERARIRTQADVMLRAVERRRAGLEARFGAELRAWAEAQLTGKRTRTLHLLTGSVALRTVPGGPRVVDKARALAWAREHLAVAIDTRLTETLRADVLRQYVAKTGEVPDGVDLAPPYDALNVKAARPPKGKA